MKILGAIPKTNSGNQYALEFTDRYMMLARSIPLTKGKSIHAASVLVGDWVILYDAPTYLLNDNGHNSLLRSLQPSVDTHASNMWLQLPTIPKTMLIWNGLTRPMLHGYAIFVAEHQTDWDWFGQPLTYPYNAQSTSFDENNLNQSHFVISAACPCRCRSAIVDNDRTQFIWRVHFAKSRHCQITY